MSWSPVFDASGRLIGIVSALDDSWTQIVALNDALFISWPEIQTIVDAEKKKTESLK